jgi:hypothetical protein
MGPSVTALNGQKSACLLPQVTDKEVLARNTKGSLAMLLNALKRGLARPDFGLISAQVRAFTA